MRRFLALLLIASAVSLVAADARAGEIYVVVERTAAPGDVLPVTVRSGREGMVLVRAWRIGRPEALQDAGVALDRGETLAFLDPQATRTDARQQESRRAAGLEPVLAGAPFAVPADRPHEIELRFDEPGLYLLAVTSGRDTAYATALVSDLALVLKRSGECLLAWAVDRTTGRAWEGVEVSVAALGGGHQTGTTDTDGLVVLEGPIPPTTDVRATAGPHLVLGRSHWHAASSSDRRVYLHTHQPAYRPGERVEVRGIVRSVDGGRQGIDPAVREATVRLLAPGNREMGTAVVAVSVDMGTFDAGFDLAEDAPTGDWAVVTEIGGRGYEAPLKVSAYRRPAFEVTVHGVDPRVLAGTKTAFDINAAFYDGGRMGKAPVLWQLLYHRVDREVFPEDEFVALFFGSEREAYRPRTLATGQGTLDDLGRLQVGVEAPADAQDGYLSLQATVTGPDRTAVVATGRIAVSAAPLMVDLRSNRHLYGPEDVVQVTIRAELADGSPARAREGVLTVGLAPRTAGSAPEETWLHTLSFVTDDEGRATCRAPLAGPGRYALAVAVGRSTDDPPGPPAHARIHVWAVGERSTPGSAGHGLQVVADRDAFRVGEVARLLVLPEDGSRPVLATLERDGLLSHALLQGGEVAPLWDVPIREDHVPNVFATFSMVDHGRLLTTRRVLRIPPHTRLLDTSIAPDATELAPGATSGLTIEVKDHEGRPVEGAEVGVAVVDEALFALHADASAPIEAFFHPPVRNAVGTEALLDWACVGWADLAVEEKGDESPESDSEGVEIEESLDERDETTGADPCEPPQERAFGGDACGKKIQDTGPQAIGVREDFRSAVFWQPALRTDAHGRVRVDKVRYGDSLTRWRITARGVDRDTRVGTGRAFVRTRRKVAAGVTLPRFLRAGDTVLIPLVLRNLTGKDLGAEWELRAEALADGWHKAGACALGAHATRMIEEEFHSRQPETVSFRARLTTEVGSDAERRELPVLPRGILKVEGRTIFAGAGESTIEIAVPAHAEPSTVSCRVSVEPAYAQAMTSALPYLLAYPYGCTEQTLNRFVPLLAAVEALAALGREPEGLVSELPTMIDACVKQLQALQHADGAFGWWKSDPMDPGMTALVVRGLSRLAVAEGGNEAARVLRDRAADALVRWLKENAQDLDVTTRASVVLALASADRFGPELLGLPGDGSWRRLPPQARALLLRAAVVLGREDLVTALRGVLDDEARREGDLVWWSSGANGTPTRWQDDSIETTANVLLALLEAGVRPEVLEGGARWLLDERVGGGSWRSTRDTGAAVEFLAAYVRATGDLGAGRTVLLALDGETVKEMTWSRETPSAEAAVWEVPAEVLVSGGSFALTLRCPEGRASAAVALSYFETGPAIRACDAGFAVTRRFFRLSPVERDGKVVFDRTAITETLPVGTLVECEVEVVTPRPREYVMVTSSHAGGFEPVRETGMEVPGRTSATDARKDGRDDRTMFFVARLGAGRHILRHTLRATHVGAFTALPAMAELMYFPDVRGNCDGELWQVTPAGPVGEK